MKTIITLPLLLRRKNTRRMHGKHIEINVPNSVTMEIQSVFLLPLSLMNVICVVLSNEVSRKGSFGTLIKQNEFEMIVHALIMTLRIVAKNKDRFRMNYFCYLNSIIYTYSMASRGSVTQDH